MKITITPAEAIALDPQAQQHYEHAMKSGDTVAYVPPFKLFTMEVAHSPSNQCILTPALGLQCKTGNINLLRELFTCLFTTPPLDIAYLQYTPSGLQSLIGETNYCHMLSENNKYLAAITTIPIEGIADDTLDLTVIPPNAKHPNDQVSIRNILLTNTWCIQVEPTQTPGKILIVTTKGQIMAAQDWLNENLSPLFTVYLACNPAYKPTTDQPIPIRTDIVKQTSAMQTYAQSLIWKYHVSLYQPQQTNKQKYNKPPASTKCLSKLMYDPQNFPPLPSNKNTEKQTTQTQNNPPTNMETTTHGETPNTPKIDLDAIQKDLECSLREDFQNLINQEIGPLRQEFKTTTTELRQKYDQMASMVAMLHKQNAQIIASLNQMNKPTLAIVGDGNH